MSLTMRWFGVVFVGVVGLGVASGQSTAKRPMTFQDLMAMKRVSDPQVSPSGKWVMFGVTDVSLEKNTKVNHLWVVGLSNPTSDEKPSDMGHPSAERQVTFGAGESSGRFSPDGKWVSYTLGDDVWLAAWDEAAGKVGEAKPLTRVSGGGADGAVWSPDSKRLMFTAMVWPECSVKVTDPTRDDRAVTDGAPGVVVGGTRSVAAWKGAEPAGWAEEDACDHAKDAAVAATPVKGQVWDGLLYRHWDHWTGEKRTHILVVNVDGSGTRDLTPASVVGDAETPTFFVGGAQNYAWAPDSKEIAYVTNLDAVPAASTNNDVFTLRLDEAGAKAVKVANSPGSDDGPAYSPDGKYLAFRSQARNGFESDKFRLMVMDRRTKAIKELMPQFDQWVDEFAWTNKLGFFYFAAPMQGEEPVFVGPSFIDSSNPAAGTTAFDSKTKFDLPHGEYSDLRVSTDDKYLVAVRVAVDSPAEIYARTASRCDRNEIACIGSQVTQLTHINQALLAAVDLHTLEPFWFTGAEGTKVEGFLMKPPNFDPAKKYPVKFLMHGGPQTAWGDGWSYRWNWELMAASGYVVVGINRRGSTGYGQKFVDEVSGDWGGRAYVDLMKGLDYAEAHYSFIDKNRECALGASYGGFMADWVLTHTNRFKCIVTHDGMYDPVSAWGDTEEMWFNEWEFRRPEDFPKGWDGFSAAYNPMGRVAKTNAGVSPLRPSASGRDDASVVGGGHPAEPWRYQNLPADQDPFRKWAPMRFIENAKTPTLVIHSQRDMRLDVSQGMELFGALQRLGVPSKMLYFPDEGHWILKPQNSQLWNKVVGDWCDRWTHSGKYAEQGIGNRE
jgi:dipeptidyl aminopeptidase/acylaminoacyl peptidase